LKPIREIPRLSIYKYDYDAIFVIWDGMGPALV